jgi:hypothetical protein
LLLAGLIVGEAPARVSYRLNLAGRLPGRAGGRPGQGSQRQAGHGPLHQRTTADSRTLRHVCVACLFAHFSFAFFTQNVFDRQFIGEKNYIALSVNIEAAAGKG